MPDEAKAVKTPYLDLATAKLHIRLRDGSNWTKCGRYISESITELELEREQAIDEEQICRVCLP